MKDDNTTEKLGRWRFRVAPGVKVLKRTIEGREYRAGKPGYPRWYHTNDDALAERLRAVPVHPNSPGSPKCFQVLDAAEARRVHEAEQAKVEPQGPDDATKAPRRRGGRSRRGALAAAAD